MTRRIGEDRRATVACLVLAVVGVCAPVIDRATDQHIGPVAWIIAFAGLVGALVQGRRARRAGFVVDDLGLAPDPRRPDDAIAWEGIDRLEVHREPRVHPRFGHTWWALTLVAVQADGTEVALTATVVADGRAARRRLASMVDQVAEVAPAHVRLPIGDETVEPRRT